LTLKINHQFLEETNLPTPMTTRVELLIYWRVIVKIEAPKTSQKNTISTNKNMEITSKKTTINVVGLQQLDYIS